MPSVTELVAEWSLDRKPPVSSQENAGLVAPIGR